MQQAAYSRFDGDDAGNRQGTLPIRGTYAAAPRGDDGSSAETVMVGTSGPDSTCKCNGWFRVGLF